MNRKSAVIYSDWLESVEALSEPERGALLLAMLRYISDDSKMPELSGGSKLVFIQMRQAFDRDFQKRLEKAAKLAENGRRGGQKKAENSSLAIAKFAKQKLANPSKAKQTLANSSKSSLNVNVNENVNENVNVNVNENVSVNGESKPLGCTQREALSATGDGGQAAGGGMGLGNVDTGTEKPDHKADVPYEKIRELWNATATKLGACRGINGTRKRLLAARWAEHPDLDFWRDVFQTVNDSDFLTGDNKRKWKASIDFPLRADKLDLILEGRYTKPKPKDEYVPHFQILKEGDPIPW